MIESTTRYSCQGCRKGQLGQGRLPSFRGERGRMPCRNIEGEHVASVRGLGGRRFAFQEAPRIGRHDCPKCSMRNTFARGESSLQALLVGRRAGRAAIGVLEKLHNHRRRRKLETLFPIGQRALVHSKVLARSSQSSSRLLQGSLFCHRFPRCGSIEGLATCQHDLPDSLSPHPC